MRNCHILVHLAEFSIETEWSFKSIERIKYLSKTHAGMLGVFGLSAWGWSEYGRVRVVVHSIAIVISIVPIRRVRVVIIIYRVVSRRASSFSWNQQMVHEDFSMVVLNILSVSMIGKLKVWNTLKNLTSIYNFKTL